MDFTCLEKSIVYFGDKGKFIVAAGAAGWSGEFLRSERWKEVVIWMFSRWAGRWCGAEEKKWMCLAKYQKTCEINIMTEC